MLSLVLLTATVGLAACRNDETLSTGADYQSNGGSTAQVEAPTTEAEAPIQDTVVIPGERIGPVTSDTSRAELGEMFGEEVLIDQEIGVGEGFSEPGTVVDLGNGQQFSIIWQDEAGSQPLMAMDFGPAWTTPEGVGVGSSLGELQNALGQFQVYGFGWDYEGTLVLEGSNLDAYHGDLFLRMRPDSGAIADHDSAYKALMGDGVFASDNPNLEPLQPQVYAMEVYLNPLSE